LAYYFKSYWRFVVWSMLLASVFISVDEFLPSPDSELSITLLDVGQGLSMVVHVKPENYTLVYDTGPRYSSGFTLAEAVVLPFLRSNGIKTIDRLIISHADNDHIGGYQAVVNAIVVNDVLTSRVDVLPNAQPCYKGQQWQVGDVRFEMLSPDSGTPQGSNNMSCVLKIELAKTSVLITGDIEKQVERYLLQQSQSDLDKLKANIMLVPHQGSRTSSTPSFIDQVKPELVFVAAGYLNHYGHPHPDVVERYQSRGMDFVSTIVNGSVIIKINQQGWQRQSFRDVKRGFWHHQKKPNWD